MLRSRLYVPFTVLAGLSFVLHAAEPAGKPDPHNCTWILHLQGFFPGKDKRGGDRPLDVYPVRRDGTFLFAVATSRTWNLATHLCDLSQVSFADGKLQGTMRVTLQQDPWVPRTLRQDHHVTVKLDATVDPDSPDKEGAVQGTYAATFTDERIDESLGDHKQLEGKLSGKLEVPNMTPWDRCTLALTLNNVLIGGKDEYMNRIALALGVRDGNLTSRRWGLVNMRNAGYDFQDFDEGSLKLSEHTFEAEATVPHEILNALGDNGAVYHVAVKGYRVNNLIGGTVTTTVRQEGKPEVVKQGSFKGGIAAYREEEVSVFAKDLKSEAPWFVPVKDWKPLQPGEHPRLFFRKDDLPALRERAATPQGRAILKRLRETLGGGEAMPEHYSASKQAYDKSTAKQKLPEGAYTMSHAAGFGFLYQLTGERKYAELARQCVEKAWAGQRDRDDRYAWCAPGGELRAGPSIACYAMAYDLCYDAWDEAFRKKCALAIQEYDDAQAGEWAKPEGITLRQMAMTPKHGPNSNHFGAVLGGAGIAVLAVLGDPGTDEEKLTSYLRQIEKNIPRAFSGGFGDRGHFNEGPGPSHVGSNSMLVPLFQSLEVAQGRDYINAGRTHVPWLTLRWVMEVLPGANGQPYYPCRYLAGNWRSYGTEEFLRGQGGVSHGGWFAQGFGAIPDDMKPALRWTYDTFCAKADGAKFDAHNYPHRAMLAFINWPLVEARNPAEAGFPKAVADKQWNHFVFRNRWKDADDIVVTLLLRSVSSGGQVWVWGLGERFAGLNVGSGVPTFYEAQGDGSGVMAAGDTSLAVDFSGASGWEGLVVAAGPKASLKESGKPLERIKAFTVKSGATTYCVVGLAKGPAPEPKADGDKLVIGPRVYGFDGKRLVVEK